MQILNISKFLLILFFIFFGTANSSNVKIKYKVGEKIITNVDIIEEIKYLVFFKPSLKKVKKNDLYKLAENSLIRQVIKNKELDRIYEINKDYNFVNNFISRLFKEKGVDTELDFKNLLNKENINYDDLIIKLKYEGLWNDLVYKKYNNSVKIDKNYLRNELLESVSNNKKFEYNLSEILFEVPKDSNLDKQYEIILENIKINGFENTAIKFSISETAFRGGNIGWIKETLLSENLRKILNNMKISMTTKPLKYPNGFLILKINKKKEFKEKIDINKELQEIIKFEKNKQLNQFSLLFYKRLKQNTIINEY